MITKYDFSHLTQKPDQQVGGPIQDDEALLLFGIIRTMRVHNVLEVGGLNGYSSFNFLKAILDGKLYTVDINHVHKLCDNHIVIKKNCRDITASDVQDIIQMIFFDAHDYEAQLVMYETLLKEGLLDEDLIMVFHDTNLHPEKSAPWSYFIPKEKGWCHQSAERRLVEHFRGIGYDVVSFHTKLDEHSIRCRHGLTVVKKHKFLTT